MGSGKSKGIGGTGVWSGQVRGIGKEAILLLRTGLGMDIENDETSILARLL